MHVIVACVAVFAAVPNAARAAGIFSSTATSTISVDASVGPGAVFITDFVLPTMGPVTTGTGAAAFSIVNGAGFGTNTGTVSGSASSPPDSFASVGVEAMDFIEVSNILGPGPHVLTIRLAYTASSSVSTSDMGDGALASYNIHVTGADDEIGESLEVDLTGLGGSFVPVTDFEVISSIFAIGGSSAIDSDFTIPPSILIRYTALPLGGLADGEYAFSIFTRASGAAQALTDAAAVPEPSSMALWALVLAVGSIAACRIRRQPRAAV